MTTSPKIFSLQGKGLKLDTRADIELHLRDTDPAIVEEVHLGGNTIGIEAAQALGEWLEKTQVLKVADFADIFTGRLISEIPQALTSICDALITKTSLIELDLSDNAFGGRSVDPLVPLLSTNLSLSVLKLNNNGLGPTGGAVIARALRESALASKKAGKKSNLRVLVCGRNRLEDGSAGEWSEAFKEHGGIEEIRMPQNGIRMDGIDLLVKGIGRNPGLLHLDLQDNAFGELGSTTMSQTLSFWPSLHTLNLSDCYLAEEGEISPVVTALVDGSNPKLTTLQLQNNNFGEDTWKLLAAQIDGALGAVKRLEVQWNEVEEGEEDIAKIKAALKSRGGKLIVDDDEEEQEQEEEEEQKEKEEKEEKEEEKEKEEKPAVEAPKTALDTATDALAELMSKVSISNSGVTPSSS